MKSINVVRSVEDFRGASGYGRHNKEVKFYDSKRAELITSENAEFLARNLSPTEVYFYRFPLIEAGAAKTTLERLAQTIYSNGKFTCEFVKDPRVDANLVFPHLTRQQIINWHALLERKGLNIDYAEVLSNENFNGFSAELNCVKIIKTSDIKMLVQKGISADILIGSITPALVADNVPLLLKNGAKVSDIEKELDVYLWVIQNATTATKLVASLTKAGRENVARDLAKAALDKRRGNDSLYFDPKQFPAAYGGYVSNKNEEIVIKLFVKYASKEDVLSALHPDVTEHYSYLIR
ncbi:MAG: hypothetical protein Q4B65_00005 [Candidatus Saccharibacteria bacterium]|nr:hypothetical protein [Candidatus Saccharibacteria bacterium]